MQTKMPTKIRNASGATGATGMRETSPPPHRCEHRRTVADVDGGGLWRRRQFVGDVRVSIMCGCLFQNVFFCPGELPVACIFLPANLPVASAKTDH